MIDSVECHDCGRDVPILEANHQGWHPLCDQCQAEHDAQQQQDPPPSVRHIDGVGFVNEIGEVL